MESQSLDYDTVRYYLAKKWEIIKSGKLPSSDEKIQQFLRLLIFNLSMEKSLDVIPSQKIQKYLISVRYVFNSSTNREQEFVGFSSYP